MRASRLRRENNSRRRAVIRKRKQRIIERREKWFRIVNREGTPKIE
ncbi:hypothetical protein DFO83_10673 [Idiomarina loihiensis]|nr:MULTISPECIES: hypothetical protein [Idiomarina]PWW36930.1 hypothetical protein DFO83_10673 [Idiomarina loihiensis]TDP46738.1 hypothetical protein DET58_10674 [Idiomarina loihiensis]TDS23009.1 hypothetical protein DET62_10674 [Idiomarina sp. H2]